MPGHLSDCGYGARAAVPRTPGLAAACALFAALLAASRPADAQLPPDELKWGGFSLYVDQDTFVRPPSDKDYTMGVVIELSGAFIKGGLRKPLDGIDWLTQAGGLHDRLAGRGVEAHGLEIGVSAFTPRKGNPATEPGCEFSGCVLERTDPIYNDRPYASILLAGVSRTSAHERLAFTTDVTVGILGLRLAEAVQTWIHENISDDVRPGGWPNQISDGFELTAKYRAAVKRLLLTGRLCGKDDTCPQDEAVSSDLDPLDDHWFDLTLDAEANLGYYTNAAAGLRARLGFVDSPYWGADRRPVSTTRVLPRESRHRARVSELYVYASIGGEAWAYNGLLQGQLRESAVTLSFATRPDDPNALAPLNRFVWDAQLGATVRFRRVTLTYQWNVHSALFEGPHSRNHRWGGVYLSLSSQTP